MDTDKYFNLLYKLLLQVDTYNFLASIAPFLVPVEWFTQSSSEQKGKRRKRNNNGPTAYNFDHFRDQKSSKQRCNFGHMNSTMTPMEMLLYV